ncbi:MAG: fibrobacter succinogenes major paralogous domain-containing protein [Bacteroidales bacterium]|nr:fibrobacter succinogenes major paralogous domain-containing protein [Bacteroidales bacterium]
MNRIIITIGFILLTTLSIAQVPQEMSYQAIIRNSNGELIKNQNVGMRISIIQDSITGKTIYSEILTPVTNENGLVSLSFGGKTGFDCINWTHGPFFIKTETDATGGSSYTIVGVSQLLSVPYALSAGKLILNKNDINYEMYLMDNGNFTGIPSISIESPYDNIPEITDADGNKYSTVKIGSQIWMAENLKTTKYKDGTLIPNIIDQTTWGGLTTDAYCWYNNDSITFGIVYGALYNWYAVNTSKLCPEGWHVPTEEDWSLLNGYLGLLSGGRLKEKGNVHWESPNTDAINDSKFNGLPGGNRYGMGYFLSEGMYGYWWHSGDPYGNNYAKCVFLKNSNNTLGFTDNKKVTGNSIRCIKD